MVESRGTRFVESNPFDLSSFHEAVKGRIDKAQGVIRNVRLMSLESKNQRSYRIPDPKLFEGIQVRLDHHGKENGPEMPTDPSFRDIWATTENAKTGPDGVYADLRYNPKHKDMESILWWAENTPTVGGFSPVTWGLHNHSNGETIIDILRVESVDLVGRPATTSGFFESEALPMAMTEQEMTKFQEAITAQAEAARKLQESEKALTAERELRTAAEARATKAEGEIATAKAAEIATARKTAREALITAAKLPDDCVTAEFREAVIGASTDALAGALIATVQRAAGAPKSVSTSPGAETKGQESVKVTGYEDAKQKGLLAYEKV